MTPLEAITILVENTNESNLKLIELNESIEANHSLLLEIQEAFRLNTDEFNDKEQMFVTVINNSVNAAVNLQREIFQHGMTIIKEQQEKTELGLEILSYSINNFQ